MLKNQAIFGIGYSTRTIDTFINLLRAHGIQMVIDIRTIPRSHYTQDFNQDSLKNELKNAKIGYRHLKNLGGLRHPKKDSINRGWRNASFRGFADYMQSQEFKSGLKTLEKLALKRKCVLMCAEGNPFRCHRSLIADALQLRNWKFLHIQSKRSVRAHRITPFLQIKKEQLIYPSEKTLR